jgi:hypothetical protein
MVLYSCYSEGLVAVIRKYLFVTDKNHRTFQTSFSRYLFSRSRTLVLKVLKIEIALPSSGMNCRALPDIAKPNQISEIQDKNSSAALRI